MEKDDVEERLVTLECTLAEFGYKTVRSGTGSMIVEAGEIRIICDQVEVEHHAENHPDWGHVVSLFLERRYVGSVHRWINEWDEIPGGVD